MNDGERKLAEEFLRRRKLARRWHRLAALTYVLAGAGFGTCLYLARTRLSAFVSRHTWPLFVGFVVLAGLLYLLATHIEADAQKEDAEARLCEEALARLRTPSDGPSNLRK
jgi:hypothetical protein